MDRAECSRRLLLCFLVGWGGPGTGGGGGGGGGWGGEGAFGFGFSGVLVRASLALDPKP